MEPLLLALRRIVADPAHMQAHVEAFLAAYWALPDDVLPWDTPLQEAIHWLGNDLQDYEPPSSGSHEPGLLRDRDVLTRVEAALRLADGAAA